MSRDPGEVEGTFVGRPEFANLLGGIQGGFLAAMIDGCVSCALLATMPTGHFAPTLELKLNYLRVAPIGTITGRGRVVHRGSTIAFLAGELYDAEGNLTTTADGRLARIDQVAAEPTSPIVAGQRGGPSGAGSDSSTSTSSPTRTTAPGVSGTRFIANQTAPSQRRCCASVYVGSLNRCAVSVSVVGMAQRSQPLTTRNTASPIRMRRHPSSAQAVVAVDDEVGAEAVHRDRPLVSARAGGDLLVQRVERGRGRQVERVGVGERHRRVRTGEARVRRAAGRVVEVHQADGLPEHVAEPVRARRPVARRAVMLVCRTR